MTRPEPQTHLQWMRIAEKRMALLERRAQGKGGGGGGVGTPGPPGEDGKPGLIWRGPWSAATTYDIGDGVSYAGTNGIVSSYIALTAGANHTPPEGASDAFWGMLAQEGAPGPKGDPGDPGGGGGPGGPITWPNPVVQRQYTVNDTWVKPVGLAYLRVRAQGSGGAGGGRLATAGTASVGAGGGGGGYVDAIVPASLLPDSVPITIGAQGLGVVGAAGGDGGDTLFGTLITAQGGKGGGVMTTPPATTASATGGLGGGAVSSLPGRTAVSGTNGQDGIWYANTGLTGGGLGTPGAGGSAGGGWDGAHGVEPGRSGEVYSATGPGGGGSGAYGIAQAAVQGGNGQVGRLWIEEFYVPSGSVAPDGALLTDRLRLSAMDDVSLTSTLHAFQIGADTGGNLAIDSNEIMARNNGLPSGLSINNQGGDVLLGDATSEVDVPGLLRLLSTADLSLTSTGHAFQIGPSTGVNIGMDNNEITARNNGVASQLNLNIDGGPVAIGDADSEINVRGVIVGHAAGTVAIVPSAANTPTSVTITLPAGRFTAPPAVQVTPSTGAPGTLVLGVGVTAATTTSAILWLTRTNTTSTTVYWTATKIG